jgi:hypothetical protein
VVGSLKVKGIYHLELPSGDAYQGYSFYEVLDKDMKPLVPPVTGFVTNVGKRLMVDLEGPPFQPQPDCTSVPGRCAVSLLYGVPVGMEPESAPIAARFVTSTNFSRSLASRYSAMTNS